MRDAVTVRTNVKDDTTNVGRDGREKTLTIAGNVRGIRYEEDSGRSDKENTRLTDVYSVFVVVIIIFFFQNLLKTPTNNFLLSFPYKGSYF